jgi:cytoskeleton protein RodZ
MPVQLKTSSRNRENRNNRMDELGSFLKQAREQAKISLVKMANDTHISKKYLEALENEEFSAFPGEAYLKGFLRTYCEYLNLDSNEILRRYQNLRIAEQDAPLDQLLVKPGPNLRPFFVIGGFVLVIALLVFGVVQLVLFIGSRLGTTDTAATTTTTVESVIAEQDTGDQNEYKLVEKEKIFNLEKGDSVVFNVGSEKHTILVKSLTPAVIMEDSKERETYLFHGHNHKLDFNNDGYYDFGMTLNFWDEKLANVTLNLFDQEEQMAISSDSQYEGFNAETIISRKSIEPIEISLTITNPTYLRYQTDNNKEVEEYFSKETVRNLKADRQVVFWFSNAGAAKLNFTAYDKVFSPGNAGVVAVKLIKWSRNDGEYDLQVSSLK